MPLAQLNLKLPPAVLAQWRAQAASEGLSVRDWLLATLAPTAEPLAAPAGGSDLADRVSQLEAAVALLQARPARSTRTVEPVAPLRVPLAPQSGDLPAPAGAVSTADLAMRLGMRRQTLNARIARAGRAHVGLELTGWRCVALEVPRRGGPPQAFWVPAES